MGTIRTTRNCALMLATNVAAHHVERRASDEAKEAVKAIVDILSKWTEATINFLIHALQYDASLPLK